MIKGETKMTRKISSEEKRRLKETTKSIIKKYWDGEGSSTYAFCIILYDCMLTLSLVSKTIDQNIVYGTEEYSLYLGILAIIAIVDFVILDIIFEKCKKKGHKGIYIKIITFLAIALSILEIIF